MIEPSILSPSPAVKSQLCSGWRPRSRDQRGRRFGDTDLGLPARVAVGNAHERLRIQALAHPQANVRIQTTTEVSDARRPSLTPCTSNTLPETRATSMTSGSVVGVIRGRNSSGVRRRLLSNKLPTLIIYVTARDCVTYSMKARFSTLSPLKLVYCCIRINTYFFRDNFPSSVSRDGTGWLVWRRCSPGLKVLKHSTRLFLQAIVGPNSMSVSRAWMFHFFLDQPYMYRSKSAQR